MMTKSQIRKNLNAFDNRALDEDLHYYDLVNLFESVSTDINADDTAKLEKLVKAKDYAGLSECLMNVASRNTNGNRLTVLDEELEDIYGSEEPLYNLNDLDDVDEDLIDENRGTLKPVKCKAIKSHKTYFAPYDIKQKRFAAYRTRFRYDSKEACMDAINDPSKDLGYETAEDNDDSKYMESLNTTQKLILNESNKFAVKLGDEIIGEYDSVDVAEINRKEAGKDAVIVAPDGEEYKSGDEFVLADKDSDIPAEEDEKSEIEVDATVDKPFDEDALEEGEFNPNDATFDELIIYAQHDKNYQQPGWVETYGDLTDYGIFLMICYKMAKEVSEATNVPMTQVVLMRDEVRKAAGMPQLGGNIANTDENNYFNLANSNTTSKGDHGGYIITAPQGQKKHPLAGKLMITQKLIDKIENDSVMFRDKSTAKKNGFLPSGKQRYRGGNMVTEPYQQIYDSQIKDVFIPTRASQGATAAKSGAEKRIQQTAKDTVSNDEYNNMFDDDAFSDNFDDDSNSNASGNNNSEPPQSNDSTADMPAATPKKKKKRGHLSPEERAELRAKIQAGKNNSEANESLKKDTDGDFIDEIQKNYKRLMCVGEDFELTEDCDNDDYVNTLSKRYQCEPEFIRHVLWGKKNEN